MSTIKIGNKTIGEKNCTFVIAEAGSNHDGKLDQAKKLIDVAADAGVDAVKFQVFTADKIVAKTKERASYLNKIVSRDETMHDIFKKLELPREWLQELADYSSSKNLIFLATPFDEDAVNKLEEVNMAAYKIASFELVHLPLLKHAAKTKKPIVLSTGLANLEDIKDAVEAVRSTGNNQIALLHCAVNYPPKPEDINLAAMNIMQDTFKVPVGFSDHTLGHAVPIAAVARGASIIEKHFTIDKTLPGPDQPFALVIRIIDEHIIDGKPVKECAESEKELFIMGRRSLFAAKDIPKGTKLTRDLIDILRPGIGLAPKHLDSVIGREARINITANEPITWEKISK